MRIAISALAALVSAVAASAGATARSEAPIRFADVIPRPVSMEEGNGTFTLIETSQIQVLGRSAGATAVAEALAGMLRPATGYPLPVVRERGTRAGSIVLSLGAPSALVGPEGYELRVAASGVRLSASRPAGLFHGIQTLRQLLPHSIERSTPRVGQWPIRVGVIRDRPRFAWRGAMLDLGRHFFGVRDIERYIDLLALHKLNRLHLHLSDDQGWRIAIRSWPRLTAIGGRTAVGGGAGGHLTQRQYAELLAYADARFVTIVPEIDMPGHTNAALAAYGRLTCTGRAPEPYTGIDVGFSSLCIRKELTYRFVDDVVSEIARLTTGPYFHMGGDEALATDPADYRRFVERVQRIVRSHGKRVVGWEEIAKARLAKTSIVQHWHSPELARSAVARGAKVIMSPATRVYLDMKYGPDSPLGLSWAGYTSVRDAYTWDPATQVEGVGETDVLGIEAPLWTETASTLPQLEYLAFPRLVGVSEIAWSPGAGRSWRTFRPRLGRHGARLRALGVQFFEDPAVPWRVSASR